MKAQDPKEWMKDYSEFLNTGQVQVPKELSQKVLKQVHTLLNPNAWFVFTKVLGVQLIVGFLSLGVCHQFGMNPFGTESSLDSWFMSLWGHQVCMIACGVFFCGAGVLSAAMFLKIEELKALKKTEFLQTLGFGLTSLTLFAFFGAEMALTIAGLWLLGAIVGGILAAEFAWKVRRFA